ncbi:hypothetical protein C1922_03440 [Stenotrophomonas sp. ZAC14D2_NAIMI4_7]|nr:hypothetical protein C1922_03440 [Stenotrophomonas sp. ZAC14D2_NAIMI4_7]
MPIEDAVTTAAHYPRVIAALGDAAARLPHDLAGRLELALRAANEDSASPQRAFHERADLAASTLAGLLQLLHASERVCKGATTGPAASGQHARASAAGLPRPG